MKGEGEADTFPDHLLQHVLKSGHQAMIGFWESLFVLRKSHPNILAVVDEITNRGGHLVNKILLDEHEHTLSLELRDIQTKHKQHLLEETKTLVEPRPPGSTQDSQGFPINERYVNLTVVSINTFWMSRQHELIESGIQHEKFQKDKRNHLEPMSTNRLFQWSHQSQCVPHAVMVSGVPGIGKTTLMQKIVYDWVNGEHYQNFAFVFFFKFRELNKVGEVSLEEMILQQYPHLGSQIGNILQDPERLLFVFDGLDESVHQMDFRSSTMFFDPADLKRSTYPNQREDIGVIVDSLVTQSLLKGCSVLMTSHITRLASINTHVFQRRAEILGFLHRDRLIYFERVFENKELTEKALHYVQENDALYTLCFIPSYCWIVCTVLSMCIRAKPAIINPMAILPKTVTQLYVTFVCNILANQSNKKDNTPTSRDLLTSIGWMAEHGVRNHITVFDEHHLDSFGVRTDNNLFSCFMMESGRPPGVIYTFLHLTLQEFFAALVHFINYKPKTLKKSLCRADRYRDNCAEIFLCFLCGLSDSSTRSMLESHVGELSAQASRRVLFWLQRKTEKQIPDKVITGTRELLDVFYYLHESRNRNLVLQCVGSDREFDFSNIILTPVDCSVLSFILESCRETETLNLMRCKIQNEAFRKLVPALHTVRNLRLKNNNLTDSSCPDLASGIRNNQTLRRLDLSVNNLKGPHFSDLMTALSTSRIEEMILYGNKLTDRSCTHLASGIRSNQTLKRLDLSMNNLEGPHFSDLMTALPTSRIEELLLNHNHLTDSSCPHLASGIRNNQTLRKFHLSGNKLQGPHFSDLMTTLPTSRIEELLLDLNNLTDSSCPHLASGIRNNQTLRKFDLSGNNLEGPHFIDLMTALSTSRIEELLLTDNKLTGSSFPDLAMGIRNNQTLRRLNLDDNNLEGPHFSDLMTAVSTSQIEELLLRCNQLTDRSCTHLASGIRKNQTLRRLDLSRNNLKGPHFSDLMTALPTSRIEELLLHCVMLTDEYTPALVSLSNCTNLTLLDLSYNKFTDTSAGYIQDLIVSSTSLKEIRMGGNVFSFEVRSFLQEIKPTTVRSMVHIYSQFKRNNPIEEEEPGESPPPAEPEEDPEEDPDNLVTPIIKGKTYSLELQPGRLFCCSETGIMFQVKSLVTITYELESESDYVEQIQKNGYDVVGPMFNITVQPDAAGVVSEVHLPHCLCLEGMKKVISLIRCGNFKDGNIKIVRPVTIGPSHIVLENPSFSGLVSLVSKLWGRPVPFKGKVLLYGRVVCPGDLNCLEYKFHLYVIPRNQPEITKLHKRKQNKGFQDMEKPHIMKNRLYTKKEYTVHVQPNGKISPELLQFEISYETENLPFVEVNVDRNTKELSLSMSLQGSEDLLWKGDITEGELKEMQLRACESVGNASSIPSTEHFVDIHYEELVQNVSNVKEVLDKLCDLLTYEQRDTVSCKDTSQDQMRELFRYVRGWGDDDKDKLLDVLEKTNKQLINRLRGQ